MHDTDLLRTLPEVHQEDLREMRRKIYSLEPSQVQASGDIIPKLLEARTKSNTPIRFKIRIEMGDGKTIPSTETAQKANAVLKGVKKGLQLH